MAFQTPVLSKWMEDAEPSLERCRQECRGSDQPARLGTLETWAFMADQELAALRIALANAEAERDALAAELEALKAADGFEEDAETARRQRVDWFADAWDLGDLSPALIGRHVHE